jgi:ADP-ribose pyrophosphatase YjhB (NUDIX family)
MIDLDNAKINTAGAYLCVQGLYPFSIGSQPHKGRIPVVRLGGHREAGETGWQCALREVQEETGLQVRLLTPPATYLLPDGDRPETELEQIRWQHAGEQEHAPLLVVAYQREGETLLSLIYLAQADELPVPSSEVQGLLLLTPEDVHRLCRERLTLEQYLACGGKAILRHDFDQSLVLEPFLQLRLLSKILMAGFL